jgi:CxxC motif-containing protein (DUF1111 family)
MDEPKCAPAGFDNKTNTFLKQKEFDEARGEFESVETICPKKGEKAKKSRLRKGVKNECTEEEKEEGGGLGPVYNATSCVACHQNPVTGSSSQVSEIRAGTHKKVKPSKENPNDFEFIEPKGGSLIHQRAIDARIQEHLLPDHNVHTLRMSTSTLGNGFVEVIQDQTIIAACKKQPESMRGMPIAVPVAVRVNEIEGDKPKNFKIVLRLGRFGWKAQEASLLNFSAGAYLNEMGITSPLQQTENLSNGKDVSDFDPVLDPEDEAKAKENINPKKHEDFEAPFGEDVQKFADFMRSTKVPPRVDENAVCVANDDPDKAKKLTGGEKIFHDLQCAVCHKPQYITPKAGTPIERVAVEDLPGTDFNDGKVPEALANKIICPFSDFMLHDIGTGDGIVQTQHAQLPAEGVRQFFQSAPDQFLQFDLGPLRKSAAEPSRKKLAVEKLDCEVQIMRPKRSQSGGMTKTPELDQRTANKIRTAPLWGLRVRPQLLHDGRALTISDAIRAHRKQANPSRHAFEKLEKKAKTDAKAKKDLDDLLSFLNSL